jgi:hypothetical protein
MYERGWTAAANGASAFDCPADDDGQWVDGWCDYWQAQIEAMKGGE